MYSRYVTVEEYKDTFSGNVIPEAEIGKMLRKASRTVDALTYNRILGKGFGNLTPFQQDVIREVVCEQAEFLYENKDELDSILSSYSLNGASVTLDSGWKLHIEQGVAIRMENYSLLKQTGLCGRTLRRY